MRARLEHEVFIQQTEELKERKTEEETTKKKKPRERKKRHKVKEMKRRQACVSLVEQEQRMRGLRCMYTPATRRATEVQ